MQITAPQSELNKAIKLASGFMATRSTQMVLQSLKFETGKKCVNVTGCNGDIWVTATVPCDVKTPGMCCPDGKKVAEIMGMLPSEDCTLIVDKSLTITQGGRRYSLPTLDASDYPEPSKSDETTNVSILAGEFRECVKSVDYAVLREKGRPALAGVLVDCKDEMITFVATDTYRVAVKTIPKRGAPNHTCILSTMAVDAIKSLPVGDMDEIILRFDATRVYANGCGVSIVAQLVPYPYIKWEKVVPSSFNHVWTLDKGDTLAALKRSAVTARDGGNRVCASVEDGAVRISANAESKGDSHEDIFATVDGSGIEVAFNWKFGVDAIGPLNSDAFIVEIVDNKTPIILRDPGDSSYFALIVPMTLSGPVK